MARIKKGRRQYHGTGTRPWTNQILIAFTGRNLAGTIVVTSSPALVVGDIVQGLVNAAGGTEDSAKFESTITVAGNIQQSSATDLTLNKYTALILRK